jgi:hypothetical protein
MNGSPSRHGYGVTDERLRFGYTSDEQGNESGKEAGCLDDLQADLFQISTPQAICGSSTGKSVIWKMAAGSWMPLARHTSGNGQTSKKFSRMLLN